MSQQPGFSIEPAAITAAVLDLEHNPGQPAVYLAQLPKATDPLRSATIQLHSTTREMRAIVARAEALPPEQLAEKLKAKGLNSDDAFRTQAEEIQEFLRMIAVFGQHERTAKYAIEMLGLIERYLVVERAAIATMVRQCS